LQSPGLHYDEAKEAGLNAMQLATGQPVTAFRDAAVQFGPRRLPLMVQDYIGSLNVLLAIPFLAIGGVNVIALRWLPLLTGALTLLLTWRVAYRLGGPVAAGITALLLAVNPSFIFWSRQGIFVTNLTALIFIASLLTGLRWWANRRPADLWLTAFLWGLGIYAKLLFVWAIGAMVAAAGIASLLRTQSQKPETENWKLKTENWY
jgi:predicted membrane-bound mannosyltransferase